MNRNDHINRVSRMPWLAAILLLATASIASAQEQVPHVGYVYPAGGQQGTTFRTLIGGQNLSGASVARISGAGVQAKVIEHVRPLNQGAFKTVQAQMQELLAKKKENPAAWTAADERQVADLRARMQTFYIRQSSVPALVETVTLEITVAADAAPGRRELRLQTDQGLTNPMVFEVGQLREYTELSGRSIAVAESQRDVRRRRPPQNVAKPAPGTSPLPDVQRQATNITLPAILNGQILPGDVDRYRFHARKGQHLVIEVGARRLIPYLSDAVPGWFQAAVTLLDASGKEVAYDDHFRFHPDPVVHREIPADGDYVLEVRDALYRGREDFIYRIAVGELPYITSIFPLGGQANAGLKFDLAGWNLPTTQLTVPAQTPGVRELSARSDKYVTNRVRFAVDMLPECMEVEGNNDPASAQRVTLPTIVNGRIDRVGDMDVFCFAGRAGQQVVAEIEARRLGSPLDSAIKLTDAKGETLALNEDYEDKAEGLITHQADSRVSVKLPADGLYYVYVVDQQQKGGADYGYRLRLDTPKPDFDLRVVPSGISARAGTTVPFTVHVLRRDGFAGEIDLALLEAPPGFKLSGTRVAAGQDVLRLTLTCPDEPRAEPYTLSIVGRATIQNRQVVRRAVPADDLMQAFIYRHLVPADELLVCVMGPAQRWLIGAGGADPIRIPVAGRVRFPLSLPASTRLGEVELELSDPPPGITIESVALGQRDGGIVFRCDAALSKPGLRGNLIVNVFAVRDPASMKGRGQRKKPRHLLTTLPAIPFEVVIE